MSIKCCCNPHRNSVYILYTKLVENGYNWCIQNENKWHTFIYIFQVKLKTKAAKSFVKNVYKSLSKWGIHFVYICIHKVWYTKKCASKELFMQFLYKIHTKCMQIILCEMYLTFQYILTCSLCTSQEISVNNSNQKLAA